MSSGKCQPFCLGLNMLKISADNQSPSESQWLSWLSVWQAEGHWRMCLADHWFRQWLVACSAPGHYLNQCLIYVNKALGNKLKLKFNQNAMFLSRKCISKFCLQNVGHFISFPVFTYSFPVLHAHFPYLSASSMTSHFIRHNCKDWVCFRWSNNRPGVDTSTLMPFRNRDFSFFFCSPPMTQPGTIQVNGWNRGLTHWPLGDLNEILTRQIWGIW